MRYVSNRINIGFDPIWKMEIARVKFPKIIESRELLSKNVIIWDCIARPTVNEIKIKNFVIM